MKLTAEQIEKLYAFTRQHYVEYYDLQTELVDHLANGVEKQWQENSKLSFEEALQNEFKKFGVFGFMDVVDKRKGAMNKKYSRLVLKELKTFFTIPKIIVTIVSIIFVFSVLKDLQNEVEVFQIVSFGVVLFFLTGLLINSYRNNKQYQKTEKRWLLKDIIFRQNSFFGLINIPVQIVLYAEEQLFSDIALFVFSVFFVIFCLLIYCMNVVIPSKAEIFLKQTYPEYEMTQSV